jgi:SPP1 family predicted phage head-tail adaptor
MPKIGALRELVAIERAAAAAGLNEFGEPEPAWVTVATVWASVLPQKYTSGVETLVQALGREAVQTSYTVTIYWRPDVVETDRLFWNGTELDIRRVIDPDGRRTWLELMCEARP